MSVLVETSLGEVVIDLFCDEAPLTAKNFLKLCKIKYYNGCLFYNVQQNFMIQTGDPTATGKGGTSVYGLMYGDQARFFEDEARAMSRKHDEAGLVSMANMGVPNSNGSQFFFSMRDDDMQHLDGKHAVFAKVMEGMDTLEAINGQFCDDNGRPYRDIRILHTYILDDPFDDPPQLEVPDDSPSRERPPEESVPQRLGALDEVSLEVDERTELEREKQVREKTARSNAVVLEMIGDLPDADMKPPENVLFVCKLNPVTTDDDLEIIFTRFGNCRAEIIRDHITGDSLNYAFVEFDAVESCEEAFKKMHNVLIDDRRIRVDFSQSVAKEWSKYKGRAQGGQKLLSGKGNKTNKQHPGGTGPSGGGKPAPGVGTNGTDGHQRKNKWGDAPRVQRSEPASSALLREGRSRGDVPRERPREDDRSDRGSRWGDSALGGRGRERGDGAEDDRCGKLERGEWRSVGGRERDWGHKRVHRGGGGEDNGRDRSFEKEERPQEDKYSRGRHRREDAHGERRKDERSERGARKRGDSRRVDYGDYERDSDDNARAGGGWDKRRGDGGGGRERARDHSGRHARSRSRSRSRERAGSRDRRRRR